MFVFVTHKQYKSLYRCRRNTALHEKYLKICDRDSPDVNDCLAEAIQEALKTLSRGIPDLGVPSIDPYEQDEIHLEYKNNQIRAQMDMKNLHVEGLKKAKIQGVRLKADDDRFHLEIDVKQPKVFIKGDYHGEGQYNSLRVNTDGQFNVTMRDLVFTWKLDGVPEKQGDETFMKIISFYMRPDVGNFRSHVTNIFPDNPQLNIPQGSALSPLLYSVYTNDIPRSSSGVQLALFADDTALYLRGQSERNICPRLQKAIEDLARRFQIWRIEINAEKSAAISFIYRKDEDTCSECDNTVADARVRRAGESHSGRESSTEGVSQLH
ncbi:RNA-directed DNA polymerase from mobile element jockey [Eumeta japonica]|uniref:RNA-directed DNA polymerase from mobile element jockey n=1 Tax=Eumeta variegata TaxID=151549 RepID=A0A4C1VNR6_EUMVA|nr:RNA-directed DNA polymerase from mobile element jockey [Eumeta japonica]